MKPRSIVGLLLLVLVVIVGLNYMRLSLRKAAAPPKPSRTPSLEDAPLRVYGRVEPLGREVFVGPQQSRRVTKILVKEGQDVIAEQVLCELDADVERQQLQVALARVREIKRRLDLTIDDLNRKQTLMPSGVIPEFEYNQKSLEAQLIRQQIVTARAEVELIRRELDTLTLRSPITGRLYKFDVRLGELLTPQDDERIVVGEHAKQIRLYVESYWMDKVRVGDRFMVQDGETLRSLGMGKVVSVSGYVGARDFRTDDALERLDTKYGQAILRFDEAVDIPLGKLVLCERPEVLGRRPETEPR